MLRIFTFLFCCVALLTSRTFAQELTEDDQKKIRNKQRVIYLYNFTRYVDWKNIDNMAQFQIGVLGTESDSLVKEIELTATKKLIKNLPVKVKYFNSIDEIQEVQILYVHQNSKFDIEMVIGEIAPYQTLLVGEEYPFHRCMINFVDIDGEFNFEINQEKINTAGLFVAPALLSFAIKSTSDWEGLFNKSEKFLEAEKKKVQEQSDELMKQEEKLLTQNNEIKEQENKIGNQKEEIKEQRNELATRTKAILNQREKLDSLLKEVTGQQESIENQELVLDKQTEEIEHQKREVEQQGEVLDQQNDEIQKRENEIAEQNTILNNQVAKIETQRLMIFASIAFALLLLLTAFLMYRSYRQKKQTNLELEEKNTAITQQKQEIEKQKNAIEKGTISLVQSAKMASLGQVAANMAHEVNTPLGAIKTSAEETKALSINFFEDLSGVIQNSTPEALEALKKILVAQPAKLLYRTTAEDRASRKAMQPVLETKGVANARNMADKLVMAGIEKIDAQLEILLNQKNRDELVDILTTFLAQGVQVSTILLAVDKASRVVTAFKSYSRTDNENQLTDINIEDSIDTVLVIYQNLLKRGIEVKKNYTNTKPVRGYANKLTQAWTNIIHNAIQAMGTTGQLTINTSEDGEGVLIEIRDTGEGIPDTIKGKVFRPFFTTKKAAEGTGLGLDIVQRIVDEHKGKVWFDSIEGKGTNFYISLPINQNNV